MVPMDHMSGYSSYMINGSEVKVPRGVVCLSEESVSQFLLGYKQEANGPTKQLIEKVIKKINFSTAFRQNGFKILHILLQHPLQEMKSSVVPNVRELIDSSDADGFLFLFGENCQYNLEDDHMDWVVYKEDSSSKKQSKLWEVKKIIWNQHNNTYKLKNSQLQTGDEEVMRRQLWKSHSCDWIKHEYKLLRREVVRTSDTGQWVRDESSAQPYPVLIHYFKSSSDSKKRPNKKSSHPNKRRKKNSVTIKSESNVKIEKDNLSMMVDTNEMDYYQTNAMITEHYINGSGANITNINVRNEYMNFQNINPSQISAYAPKKGFASEKTPVLIYCNNITDMATYYCQIDQNTHVPANIINQFLLEIEIPPTTPGFKFILLYSRYANNEIFQEYNRVLFISLPTDNMPVNMTGDFGVIDHNMLTNNIHTFRHTTTEINLSRNGLQNIHFLNNFTFLSSLILDCNRIVSTTVFPYLGSLKKLSVRMNEIDDISQFLTMLESNAPHLEQFMTEMNPCCPQGNGETYQRYRKIISSRLKNLVFLDSNEVTVNERERANLMMIKPEDYGTEMNIPFMNIDDGFGNTSFMGDNFPLSW
eukprot:TRINITY_DN4994_c0_g1_i3.p1 TRINITY_DN4994_c0_g1~~TRINITY_DN4994_c0_g1_i3.p1  ORF type:complete len:588 (-),score=108.40 TRINITY_DN4994_c0_g1_i3:55-1818(-)